MKRPQPTWWQLYLLIPIMGLLMIVEHLAPLPGVSDQLVDLGIIALVFGAMLFWLKRNAAGLEENSPSTRSQRLPTDRVLPEPNLRTRDIQTASRNYASPAVPPSLIHSRRPRRAMRSGRDIRPSD